MRVLTWSSSYSVALIPVNHASKTSRASRDVVMVAGFCSKAISFANNRFWKSPKFGSSIFNIFFVFQNTMPRLNLDERIARIEVRYAAPLLRLAVREAKLRTKPKRKPRIPSVSQAEVKRLTDEILANAGKKATLAFIVKKLNEPGLTHRSAIRWIRQLTIIQGWPN